MGLECQEPLLGLLQLGVSLVLQELLSVQGGILGSGASFAPLHVRDTVWLAREALHSLRAQRLCFSPGYAACWLQGPGDHPTALCPDLHAAICLS